MKKNLFAIIILSAVLLFSLTSCDKDSEPPMGTHSPIVSLVFHLEEFNSETTPFTEEYVLKLFFSAGDIGASASEQAVVEFAVHFGLSAEEMKKSALYLDGKFSAPSELISSHYKAHLVEEISHTNIDGNEHVVFSVEATLDGGIEYTVVYEIVYTGDPDGAYILVSGTILEYYISNEE